jgi:hypothetical protein
MSYPTWISPLSQLGVLSPFVSVARDDSMQSLAKRLVYGYGDKIINLGNLTPPVLPFAQLITSVTWKNVGWEVSYTGIVISTEFYIKFKL